MAGRSTRSVAPSGLLAGGMMSGLRKRLYPFICWVCGMSRELAPLDATAAYLVERQPAIELPPVIDAEDVTPGMRTTSMTYVED